MRIVLAGDSVFDSHAYIPKGQPSVAGYMSAHADVTDVSRDGAVVDDIAAQLPQVDPGSTAALIVSVGGNDALLHQDVLSARVQTVAGALLKFAPPLDAFEMRYRRMVEAILKNWTSGKVIVCTIYNGNFPDDVRPVMRLGAALYNDVIQRVAYDNDLRVMDIRSVCSAPEHFANPIEPSTLGSERIAAALIDMVKDV
jgi:hypothetical protein